MALIKPKPMTTEEVYKLGFYVRRSEEGTLTLYDKALTKVITLENKKEVDTFLAGYGYGLKFAK